MTTVSFMVMLPLLLHIGITMVMKNIVVQSIDQVPYDVWVFPGIILLIASVSTFSLIYRDLFDLRIHKKSFIPITLAPYGKTHLVIGFLVTSIIESLVYVIVAMGVLTVLLPEPLNWSAYFIVPLFTLLYTFLLGNLIITFSVLTDRISTYLSITISMFLFILFATGVLVEFDFYPKTIGTLLSYFPLSMILSDLRGILFFNRVEWGPIMIPVATALGWTWLNGYMLKRKLKQ
jgi:ABC-type polysaccharide/polyol phosphate export permease|tara:strand:- start:562 stop:1260 length:699 start_codon:yes stop_codon:yes gene_type:complete